MKSGAGAMALATIPGIVSASMPTSDKQKRIVLNAKDVVLFQGDSITDAGRDKKNEVANNPWSFGMGYAFLAASKLLNTMSEEDLEIYNRGISGNKVYQLDERWKKDCLELKPDVLSILIGVNDYWHKRNGEYDGTVEIYENDYRALLKRTQKVLPDVQLVLCEPFYVLETKAVDGSWVEPMKKYQAAAKRISDEFETIWVPFQKVFDEAINHAPGTYWTGDGVHPSMAGAQLMAEAWLKAVGVTK